MCISIPALEEVMISLNNSSLINFYNFEKEGLGGGGVYILLNLERVVAHMGVIMFDGGANVVCWPQECWDRDR
jgi:hypothetical protein